MPRDKDHRDKADLNAEFADSLDLSLPVHHGWAVVASFYAALHYVEYYFARRGDQQSQDHVERNRRVITHLRDTYKDYSFLYTLSKTARYYCSGLGTDAYATNAKPRLVSIRNFIDHLVTKESVPVASPEAIKKRFAPEPERPTPGKPS